MASRPAPSFRTSRGYTSTPPTGVRVVQAAPAQQASPAPTPSRPSGAVAQPTPTQPVTSRPSIIQPTPVPTALQSSQQKQQAYTAVLAGQAREQFVQAPVSRPSAPSRLEQARQASVGGAVSPTPTMPSRLEQPTQIQQQQIAQQQAQQQMQQRTKEQSLSQRFGFGASDVSKTPIKQQSTQQQQPSSLSDVNEQSGFRSSIHRRVVEGREVINVVKEKIAARGEKKELKKEVGAFETDLSAYNLKAKEFESKYGDRKLSEEEFKAAGKERILLVYQEVSLKTRQEALKTKAENIQSVENKELFQSKTATLKQGIFIGLDKASQKATADVTKDLTEARISGDKGKIAAAKTRAFLSGVFIQTPIELAREAVKHPVLTTATIYGLGALGAVAKTGGVVAKGTSAVVKTGLGTLTTVAGISQIIKAPIKTTEAEQIQERGAGTGKIIIGGGLIASAAKDVGFSVQKIEIPTVKQTSKGFEPSDTKTFRVLGFEHKGHAHPIIGIGEKRVFIKQFPTLKEPIIVAKGTQIRGTMGAEFVELNAEKLITRPSSTFVEGRQTSPALQIETFKTMRKFETEVGLKQRSEYIDESAFKAGTERVSSQAVQDIFSPKTQKEIYFLTGTRGMIPFGSKATVAQLKPEFRRESKSPFGVKDIDLFVSKASKGQVSAVTEITASKISKGEPVRITSEGHIETLRMGQPVKAVEVKSKATTPSDEQVPSDILGFNLDIGSRTRKIGGIQVSSLERESGAKAAGVIGQFQEEGSLGAKAHRVKDVSDFFRIAFTQLASAKKSGSLPATTITSQETALSSLMKKLGVKLTPTSEVQPIQVAPSPPPSIISAGISGASIIAVSPIYKSPEKPSPSPTPIYHLVEVSKVPPSINLPLPKSRIFEISRPSDLSKISKPSSIIPPYVPPSSVPPSPPSASPSIISPVSSISGVSSISAASSISSTSSAISRISEFQFTTTPLLPVGAYFAPHLKPEKTRAPSRTRAPSVAALALRIRGRGRKGELSGLELRPATSSELKQVRRVETIVSGNRIPRPRIIAKPRSSIVNLNRRFASVF